MTWDLIWIHSMGNHGAAGVFQNAGVLVVLVGSDNGRLVAWSARSHYLNQCWNIVNSNLTNKPQWNLKQNLYISLKKMHLQMSSAKWRPFSLGLNVLNRRCTWSPKVWKILNTGNLVTVLGQFISAFLVFILSIYLWIICSRFWNRCRQVLPVSIDVEPDVTGCRRNWILLQRAGPCVCYR